MSLIAANVLAKFGCYIDFSKFGSQDLICLPGSNVSQSDGVYYTYPSAKDTIQNTEGDWSDGPISFLTVSQVSW